MRFVKKILFMVFVAIILQLAVLLYFEKYYLVEKDTTAILSNYKQLDEKIELNTILIPKNDENVQMSTDGKYLSYDDGAELKVVDTGNGKMNNIKLEDNTKVLFCKWVSAGEIILAEAQAGNPNNINIAAIDLSKKESYKSLGSIYLQDENAVVKDLIYSSSDGAVYVKISTLSPVDTLYRLDDSGTVDKVKLKGNSIGNIEALKEQDILVYESNALNEIFTTVDDEIIQMNGLGSVKLLYVDSNDNIYVAQLQNGKVKKIYWGKQDSSVSEWSSKALNEQVDMSEVKITAAGKIYINNTLNGYITDISTGKQYKYKGTLLQISSDGIVSVYQGHLLKNKIQ